MFEKNLQDLVKGIRSAKGDVNIYISQCLQEIKNELKSTDPFLKAEAVRKLTYLHMQGYDMTWAAFHIVEVMSYERFAHKRIGYTAASQSFTQTTDVVLLCTNLLKKEFGSVSEYEVGLAINVLANIATTDLSRDLLGDVVAMMNSPKAYVRKKATLVLYKMFLRYPQGLRLTFDKLKERMEEPDVSVVSCAVNVICELANKKPKNYLGLAPQFFRLLTTSSNNWMLIKVVKLMASLVPEEPRLARKLLDPLATIIQNTPAKSLQYECIATVTTALLYTAKSDGTQPRNAAAVVRLCNDHLRRFIEDPDQNLRYLGLVGLSNLMESHPFVIAEHQQLIVECLAVDDITIRMRSLELLAGMVTPDNAAQIIRELMRQTLSADGIYRHELITRILHVCSVNNSRACRATRPLAALRSRDVAPRRRALAATERTTTRAPKSHGIEVARQLVDIAVRVKSVRSVMVENMIDLLMEADALSGPGASTLCEVYFAAAWIAGEYVTEYLDDVDDEEEEDEDEEEERETEEEKLGHIADLVDEMLQPRTTSLPAHVQTVYVQALLKFVTAMADRSDDRSVEQMAEMILERLPAFVQSEHIEVQERAVALQQVLLSLGLGYGSLSAEERASRAFDSSVSLDASARLNILTSFFAERLAPVGAKAQRKVPLPGDLDLDVPFSSSEASFLESGGDMTAFSSEDDLDVSFVQQQQTSTSDAPFQGLFGDEGKRHKKPRKNAAYEDASASSSSGDDASEDERERQYALEKERLRTDPFYLSNSNKNGRDANDPILHSGFAEIMDALDSTKKRSRRKDGKKKKKATVVLEDELMPDGARSSDEDRRRSRKKRGSVPADDELAAVDLSMPLREDEKIPDEHLFHRQSKTMDATDERPRKSKKDGKSKKSSKDKSSKDKKKSKKVSHRDNESGDDEVDNGRRHKKSSKNGKSRHEDEAKENLLVNLGAEDEPSNGRSSSKSSKKSSSKSRRSGDSALKEKKSSSSKKKSSKNQPHDEPLLLF
ncbi:hypothetical protein PINS_up010991 [Pythium insidiosum]|nr:hypothetical protein PINS_up010991 [Pythium insidiosum]